MAILAQESVRVVTSAHRIAKLNQCSDLEQEFLAHWPTIEAWGANRFALHGPACELYNLLYVPIDQAAGLEHVHPTWAGTFVLAAFVFLFPGVQIVLLDSDRVPITLFEVANLWKEISLLQNGLAPTKLTWMFLLNTAMMFCGKQVLIGCGGSFHQECSQPYPQWRNGWKMLMRH